MGGVYSKNGRLGRIRAPEERARESRGSLYGIVSAARKHLYRFDQWRGEEYVN